MEQKHIISHPNQTGHARSRIKTTTSEQTWTIENANRLVYTCFAMMQFFFAWGKKNHSPVCTGTAFPLLSNAIRVKTISEKIWKRRTEQKKSKKRATLETKTRPKAPEKNLEGRPISSLNKKCQFLAAANEIRMQSLVPWERNYLCKFRILNQSKRSIINNHF